MLELGEIRTARRHFNEDIRNQHSDALSPAR
jgi:hypothetical protein